jgi:hypothetical protein
MENTKNILDSALDYQSRGFSVIPVGNDKKPLISWKEFQYRIASVEEIKAWIKQFPAMNLAIVTGKISGIVVVDIEKDGDSNGYPPTVTVKTGGDGLHLYYKHPGFEVSNGTRIKELTDIRGDGGYVVAPPSVSTKGEYSWVLSLDDSDFSDMPSWIIQKTNSVDTDKKWLKGKDGVSEGSRNDTATSMAGKIISSTPQELLESLGWDQFKVWNNKNTPPLSEKELRSIWESIKKYPQDNDSLDIKIPKKSQADQLLEMILKEETEFFKNEVGDAYVRIKVKDHFEVVPVKSKNFRLWAIGLFYRTTEGKAINNDAYQNARSIIENKCIFDGNQYNIHPRVAYEEGVIWYDLADPQWRAVRIDKNGWNIENTPPILFRRYQHMRPQVTPAGSLDPHEIFEFINIENEDMKLLLLVWLISCFIKGFPHVAPMIYGPQGSAKTTTSEIIKTILDPSAMKTTRLSRDINEVTQVIAHSWITIFDNVSTDNFFDSTSDLFCTVITGGGVSKRELYSDDDDIIYDLQRVIGLNGINLAATKPDLLDRSILIELARIPEEKRKSIDDVNTDFKEKLPGILGGIFDTIVKAINIKPTLGFTKLHRMADFTVWGTAIAIALGYTQEQFFSAYTNNIKQQNESVINDSLVAILISNLLVKEDSWKGTPTQLLEKLGEGEDGTQDQSLKRDQNFPKAANALSKTINELKTSLAQNGCFVWQTGSSRKEWNISKFPQPPSLFQNDLTPSSDSQEEHPLDPTIAQINTDANDEWDGWDAVGSVTD